MAIRDIIYSSVFYLNYNVSETRFSLRLQVEPTQFSPRDGACLCLRTPANLIGVVCWCLETETSSIYWAELSIFYLKTETDSSLRNTVLNKRQDDGN
jgi:hypothetical protein